LPHFARNDGLVGLRLKKLNIYLSFPWKRESICMDPRFREDDTVK
jgi:hypothetical protein